MLTRQPLNQHAQYAIAGGIKDERAPLSGPDGYWLIAFADIPTTTEDGPVSCFPELSERAINHEIEMMLPAR